MIEGFVGRAAELAALEAAWVRASAGGAVVLVGGEAGIGKTRLVAEFTSRLGAGARVLTGLCPEAAGLPHAPFVTVARELVREFGAERVTGALPGGARRLARWLPVLGPADEDPGPAGRALLYEEVLALLEYAAGSAPTVLVLEDLHWADVSTLELASFLGRNLRRPGLLLVATYRTEETDGILALLGGLTRAGAARLELARLDQDEVALLLHALSGREPDPVTVARVHRRSEGIPLFVEALEPGGTATTPESARDLLLAGLTRMDDRSRTVLRGASALGREVSHPVLASVVGLPGPDLDEALRPLVDRRLLVVSGHGYAFRHALIRAAAYETLLPGERIRLHARCAEVLTVQGAPAAEVAAHWHAAGDRARAAGAARRAADEARVSHAPAERLRALELVLADADPAERLELLEQAVDACQHAGEYPRGVELATAALELLDPAAEPERVASMLEIRGRLRFRSNADGGPDLAAAAELLPAEGMSVVRGRVLSTLASARFFQGGPDSELRMAEETIAIGEATGDLVLRARGQLLLATYRVRAGTDDWRGPLTEAGQLAEASGDHDLLVTVCTYESDLSARVGDLGAAEAAASRGLTVAHRFGQDKGRGAVLASYLVDILVDRGRWSRARALIAETLAAEPALLVRCVLVAARAQLDAAQGLWPQALAALAEVEEIQAASGRPELLEEDWLYPALRLAAEPDSGFDARAVLDALFAATSLDPFRTCLADAARVVGDTDRQALRALLDRQEVSGPVPRAQLAEACAVLDDAGPGEWLAVADAWRALGQPYPTARALTDAGRAAGRSGDRDAARAALTEAAAIAADLGAAPLAGRIADLLDPPPAPHGLTDRERQVLVLVARGLSNRQVGRELGISQNTAGVHVSRILAKLGAASRTEAAAVAHRAGWTADDA